MKISIEFESIKDLLLQMPKFANLITGEGTPEDRIAAALKDDSIMIKITPTDGVPFTKEEEEKIQKALDETIENAASEAKKEEPKKNPPKAEKAETGENQKPGAVSETDARKILNDLVKARSNAAVKLVFKKLGVSNFGELTKAGQFAEAVELAEKVSAMDDDEYTAALKEAGIKGGKK